MRWGVLALVACGCDTSVTSAVDAPPQPDAAPDSVKMALACPQDPTLAICLSFDAPAFANPYSNEGALAVAADLKNVTRTAVGNGGAALMTDTSEMLIPMNSVITGIVAMDARIRFDADVPAGMRVGIIDSDKSSPGMSLFVYTGTSTSHRIRCNLGAVDLYADVSFTLGVFSEIGCRCEMGNVAVFKDGVKIVELGGATTCAPGSATESGLQIGQNSRAAAALPPNEPFVGAIDRVRLWTVVPQ